MTDNKTNATPAEPEKKPKTARDLLLSRLQPDCPYMELGGTARMAGYVNRQGKQVEYVEVTLDSPFPDDPDLPTFILVPKWKSDESIFKYRAKKTMATVESVPLKAVISPYEYFNKKYRKQVLYIGIWAVDPFSPGRTIELQVKDEGDRTLLSVLMRDHWDLVHVDVETDEDGED